jgi:hypothetical protein
MNVMKRYASPCLVIAATAMFLSFGGASEAATGDTLVLGNANSADATTTLSAPIAGGMVLQVANTDTTNPASTALGLQVAPGSPPLVVNADAGKAANLNADRLDGLSSGGFWKLGGNTLALRGALGFLGTTDNSPLVLKVNGQSALRLEPNGINSPNVIAGFSQNDATDGVGGATIAGGGEFDGKANFVGGSYGSVGGGLRNWAGSAATVAGGFNNRASGANSTIAGGGGDICFFCNYLEGNTASAAFSAIGGGRRNTAGGYGSAVPGGRNNTADGDYSLAAGRDNTAGGDYSFAAGYHAVADDTRSFVWSDGSWIGGDVYSPRAHSFSAHASGGFNFWTNTSGPTTGCWIAPGGGSINCSSSRHVKKDFASVNRAGLLRRLDRVPVWTWSYKAEKAGVRHIGPMSQDFARAFRVGEDDTSIAMVDADGVSLAAIQGLYRENRALEARVARLERVVTRLSGSAALR